MDVDEGAVIKGASISCGEDETTRDIKVGKECIQILFEVKV